MSELKPCPCGAVPDRLEIAADKPAKWAYAYCPVCGEWSIEFRASYTDPDSEECQKLAQASWNKTPRGTKT